jgi:hypothetical protein
MTVQRHTTVDDDGALSHILEYEDDTFEYDAVEIRHDPNNDDIIQCRGYKGDEVVYQNAFKIRDLSFEPISAIGRGESEKLLGTSPQSDTTDDDGVPDDINVAFNAIGMAVVPEGRWWIDGE